MYATCFASLKLLAFITLIIFGGRAQITKLLTSITYSLLDSNILLSALFSNALNPSFTLTVRHQVSQPDIKKAKL
jgi:methyl coenzyme M reductase subunit C